jgi:hypothetical protein
MKMNRIVIKKEFGLKVEIAQKSVEGKDISFESEKEVFEVRYGCKRFAGFFDIRQDKGVIVLTRSADLWFDEIDL